MRCGPNPALCLAGPPSPLPTHPPAHGLGRAGDGDAAVGAAVVEDPADIEQQPPHGPGPAAARHGPARPAPCPALPGNAVPGSAPPRARPAAPPGHGESAQKLLLPRPCERARPQLHVEQHALVRGIPTNGSEVKLDDFYRPFQSKSFCDSYDKQEKNTTPLTHHIKNFTVADKMLSAVFQIVLLSPKYLLVANAINSTARLPECIRSCGGIIVHFVLRKSEEPWQH